MCQEALDLEGSNGEERTDSKCRKDKDHDLRYGTGPLAEFRQVSMCHLSHLSGQQQHLLQWLQALGAQEMQWAQAPRRHALSSRWLWTFNHITYENCLEEVQGSATSSLFTPPLFQNMWPCVQLLCAECNAPCQWDLAIDKATAKWQGNDQTDLQCQATRHCHHQVHWATCAAWHWGSGPHSEGEKAPMVWTCGMLQWCSRQPLTYRLMESVGLGGPRWHGSSWQRGIVESGSSQLSTLMIDILGDLVWDLPCMQQACYLEGGPLMWLLPLYLHINQKSDYDYDDMNDFSNSKPP